MIELTNPRSERVRAVRSLSGRSARARAGRFLVEGPQGVREAVRFAAGRTRALYVGDSARERYAEIVGEARAAGIAVHEATDEVLATMSADAQGLVAVLDVAREGPDRLQAELARGPRLVAVLAHVRDPGNAGTVIRAADAAGADLVVVTSASVDIHNPKVVRSTAGSLFHLPIVAGVGLDEVCEALRAADVSMLAADGSGTLDLDDLLDVADTTRRARATGAVAGAEDPSAAPEDGDHGVPDLTAPTAWIFGNEAWGLRPEDRALADAVVRVPLRGRAESLNLAAAATVCLYASSRAQR